MREIVSRQKARAEGLTRYFTGKPCVHGHISERRTTNSKCLECQKEYLSVYRKGGEYKRRKNAEAAIRGLKLKIECFTHYNGGKKPECSNPECDVTDIRVLDLDHINGGGNKERISATGVRAGGIRFYRHLKEQGWPVGFRVLCKNCNWLAWLEKKDG